MGEAGMSQASTMGTNSLLSSSNQVEVTTPNRSSVQTNIPSSATTMNDNNQGLSLSNCSGDPGKICEPVALPSTSASLSKTSGPNLAKPAHLGCKKPIGPHEKMHTPWADTEASQEKTCNNQSTNLNSEIKSMWNKSNDISNKLSEHGVKVSDPVVIRNRNATNPSRQSGWSPCNNTNQESSRARTGTKHGRGGIGFRPHQRFNKGWNNRQQLHEKFDCKPDSHTSKWPRGKDIPKGDPERFDTKWEDWGTHTGWNESATWDDGIVGGRQEFRRVDSESGFILTDWTGTWAPPPLDWDARPAFREHQSVERIDLWMTQIEKATKGIPWAVSIEDVQNENGVTFSLSEYSSDGLVEMQGDIVPRYWIPSVIGMEAPKAFWISLISSQSPRPHQEGDLEGSKPWWETYQIPRNPSCTFLRQYEAPFIAGIDPDENELEQSAREIDLGSNQHIENRKLLELAKHNMTTSRRKKPRDKARKQEPLPASEPHGNQSIKTAIKLHIREGRPSDCTEIHQIYNHHIDATVSAPEINRCNEAEWARRMNMIHSNNLPFLVAYKRGERVRGNKRNGGEAFNAPDEIVGFAFADNFSSPRDMFRFTSRVSVYTSLSYLRKGVASCLLDAMLGIMDPKYAKKNGYTYERPALHASRSERKVQNLMIDLPYYQKDRMKWISEWLLNSFGFQLMADFPGLGVKNNVFVNLAIFLRKTSVIVNPSYPPEVEDRSS